MPTNHGFRSHDDERLFPPRLESAGDHPEKCVEHAEFGFGVLALSTVSCCRSAKFSRSKFRRERTMRMSTPNQRQNQRDMDESYSR